MRSNNFVGRSGLVTIAILVMMSIIFLFDIFIPPETLSVTLAYAIPIFISLYDVHSRPLLYAFLATTLSLVGWFVQPASSSSIIFVGGNLMIAIFTQWLVAALVRLQRQRLNEMQEKAESQRRFVNILSHEIGTALTVVTGQAFRLTKLSKNLAPKDIRIRAEKIQNAAQRIEMIIDRIRFASSFGHGSLPIEHGPVNLQTVLQQLIQQLSEENRGHSIELNLHSEPPIIDGDEMLIRQMFENIITNSLKYSSEHAKISVDITDRTAAARVTVMDHGTGISGHDLSRIRTPYYRGENSKGISGTGIGLYVVSQIVDAHKGRMQIESSPGVGTTVVIDLPQALEGAAT